MKPAAVKRSLVDRWLAHIRGFLRSKEAFTYLVGFGAPPFLFGMIAVGFNHSILFGLVNLVVVVSFIVYTINTTCRRCPFYGTNRCPVPGRILPFFLPKLKDTSISIRKIQQHYVVDLLMTTYANITYFFFCRVLWPFVIAGTIAALLIVYIPKRHHGLLYRLRFVERRADNS
ncbi:MAG: hypothetical protein AAF492_01660 [Verrucomicrobiota bacterium]